MLNPSRLTLARQRRGLSVTALARAAGVARQTAAAWEDGTQEPLGVNVVELSRVLSFPAGFFDLDDVDTVPAGAASFRASSKTTKTTRDAALAAGRVAMLINDWIERRFRLPVPDVPTLGLQAPEQAAAVLRERWGLGNAPVSNMIHLLESQGVRVFSLPAECATVDAFCWRSDGTPIVMLAPGKSAERRRFDLAHELGHLVLHGELEGFQGPTAEAEANRFASAFLMPRAALLGRPLRGATLDMVLAERRRWKVAAMALTYRLRELSFVSDWEYRQLCIELSRRGFRRSEPGGSEHESSQLLHKVLKSLRGRDSGIREIADGCQLTADEVSAHFLGLVVLPLDGGRDGVAVPNSRGRRPTGTLRLV